MEMLPEEKNLLEEIRATGVEIDDIEELMHMDQNDKALVPIVVKIALSPVLIFSYSVRWVFLYVTNAKR